MSDRLTTVPAGVKACARIALILLLLCLVGCGGSSKASFVSPPPPPVQSGLTGISPSSGIVGESISVFGKNFGSTQGGGTITFNGTPAQVVTWADNLVTALVPPGATSGPVVVTATGTPFTAGSFTVTTPTSSIAMSNFGFQCGIGDPADCQGSPIAWPTTQTPGLLRLHDAGTQWAVIEKQGGGQYDFSNLNAWLDLIAAHPGVQVSQVFTWVPCADAPLPCTAPPTAPAGTSTPPSDLGSGPGGSSPAFNNFVTAFVKHCNPNNHCVKDLIHYYEMWNEWDLKFHWTGTMAQVYQLVAVPTQIIRQNDPKAVIMTPSSTPDSDTGQGYVTDFTNWLNYENANGRISDWVDWHVYLTTSATTTATPEDRWGTYNANYLTAQASIQGWQNLPWANSETNFDGSPQLNYTCPTTYSPSDCTGQIVRWQLLHDSNGAAGVYWYKWNETIGGNPNYEPVYSQMMQLLDGGRFTAPCSANGTVWTCPFTKNSTSKLWVWTTTDPAAASFTVPAGFVDYIDLTSGAPTTVSVGQSIAIGNIPIMLE